MMFCGRIKRARDRAVAECERLREKLKEKKGHVDSLMTEANSLRERFGIACEARDAALKKIDDLKTADSAREVLTAKHQPLKHNKHRYQVFDEAGKIMAQQPMNHYRSKGDALMALRRLRAAKIEIED